jgi:hypothetical protein
MDASTVGVFGCIIIGGDVWTATRDRREDHDPRFPATDPAPDPAPRMVPGHAGGGGTLSRDQTLIPEAVGVEAARRFKITDEGVAAAGFQGGHERGEVLFRECVRVVCVHKSPVSGGRPWHADPLHAWLPASFRLAARVQRRAWLIDQGVPHAGA